MVFRSTARDDERREVERQLMLCYAEQGYWEALVELLAQAGLEPGPSKLKARLKDLVARSDERQLQAWIEEYWD